MRLFACQGHNSQASPEDPTQNIQELLRWSASNKKSSCQTKGRRGNLSNGGVEFSVSCTPNFELGINKYRQIRTINVQTPTLSRQYSCQCYGQSKGYISTSMNSFTRKTLDAPIHHTGRRQISTPSKLQRVNCHPCRSYCTRRA